MASSTINLRAELDLPIDEAGCRICMIVVRARGADMDIVVDAVSEDVDIHAQDMGAATSHGTAMPAGRSPRAGTLQGEVEILLDIDRDFFPGDAVELQLEFDGGTAA